VQDWEQGRRDPEGLARVLLALIERDADTVGKLLAV
jgi:DNA-binding transcriptional regulator YiaG